jgi:5-methyltetrahydropteroyltriglutamate--homocysteine methyltransferase
VTNSSLSVATLGVPRIGPRRELKFALESVWAGKSDEKSLLETAAALRAANWARQKALGVTVIPSNDFSLYDRVLDTSVMVGAIPEIYGWKGGRVSLSTYFATARGSQGEAHGEACAHGHVHSHGVPAQEMTKWFDSNYHYLAPELSKGQTFQLASFKPVDEYREAKALGCQTRPVLLGPVTYLKLAKSKGASFDSLSLLTRIGDSLARCSRRSAPGGRRAHALRATRCSHRIIRRRKRQEGNAFELEGVGDNAGAFSG